MKMGSRLERSLDRIGAAFDERPRFPFRLGDYEVLGPLAAGGMGQVYEARHTATESQPKRIVKLISPELLRQAGDQAVARFKREADALFQLNHPGIVRIFEFVSDGKNPATGAPMPYMVLDHVPAYRTDGTKPRSTLDDYLADRTSLEPGEAASLIRECARAVGEAHLRANVVHRDLKPANILLTTAEPEAAADWAAPQKDGEFRYRPMIIDFGIAKRATDGAEPPAAEPAAGAPPAGVTQVGHGVGTVEYMAPEQHPRSGKPALVTPAADVWSLGVLLYRLLFAELPFSSKANDRREQVRQIRKQIEAWDPQAVLQLGRDRRIPADLRAILVKCLRKNPRERYANAAELAADLELYRQRRPVSARPVGRPERLYKMVRRDPVTWSVGALSILAVTASMGYFTWRLAARNDELVREKGLVVEEKVRVVEEQARTKAALDLAARERDAAEKALAVNLVRTLARPDASLTPADVEALRALNGRRVRELFLEELVRRPDAAAAVRGRAALVLPVALGEDRDLERYFQDLILEQLRNPSVAAERKSDLIYLGALLGAREPDFAREAASILVAALQSTSDPRERIQLAQQLVVMAASLTGHEGADRATVAFRHMTRALGNGRSTQILDAWLSDAAARAVARLEPAAVAAAVGDVLETVERSVPPDRPTLFTRALVERGGGLLPDEDVGAAIPDAAILLGQLLAQNRLPRAEAARLAGRLSARLAADVLRAANAERAATAMSRLAPFLDGSTAVSISRVLLDEYAATFRLQLFPSALLQALSEPAAEAVAEFLCAELGGLTRHRHDVHADALLCLLPRLGQRERAIDRVGGVLTNDSHPTLVDHWCRSLPLLPPGRSPRRTAAVAKIVLSGMRGAGDVEAAATWIPCLHFLAQRAPAADAGGWFREAMGIVKVHVEQAGQPPRSPYAPLLALLALTGPHTDAAEAAALADSAVVLLVNPPDNELFIGRGGEPHFAPRLHDHREALVERFAILVARLTPTTAAALAEKLIPALASREDGEAPLLARTLGLLLVRLPRGDANALAARAARHLSESVVRRGGHAVLRDRVRLRCLAEPEPSRPVADDGLSPTSSLAYLQPYRDAAGAATAARLVDEAITGRPGGRAALGVDDFEAFVDRLPETQVLDLARQLIGANPGKRYPYCAERVAMLSVLLSRLPTSTGALRAAALAALDECLKECDSAASAYDAESLTEAAVLLASLVGEERQLPTLRRLLDMHVRAGLFPFGSRTQYYGPQQGYSNYDYHYGGYSNYHYPYSGGSGDSWELVRGRAAYLLPLSSNGYSRADWCRLLERMPLRDLDALLGDPLCLGPLRDDVRRLRETSDRPNSRRSGSSETSRGGRILGRSAVAGDRPAVGGDEPDHLASRGSRTRRGRSK